MALQCTEFCTTTHLLLYLIECFSAYCGGLWLASLQTAKKIAEVLGCEDEMDSYAKILEKAKEAYNRKLWTG